MKKQKRMFPSLIPRGYAKGTSNFLSGLKKGALHKTLGVSPKKKIPVSQLESAAHSQNPLTRKRANFALNARKWKH